MKKLICLVLATVLASTVLLSSCGEKDETLYIASANPMTGDSAQFGDMKVKAIQLALDECNAAGGIDGKQVELLVGDDTGNPKEAPNVAQKFASDERVLAVIGHWNSSCTLAARDIYNEAGIPTITESVNKTITDGTTPAVFRISLTDTEQAEALARYAYDQMGKRSAAILYTSNDFGNGLMNDFTASFTALGGTIVASEAYFEGQSKDFSPQLTKIKAANPDLLFVAGYYVETALIAQQARNMDFNVPMLGTEGISSEELIKLGGEAVEGIRFAGFFHPDVEFTGTKEFVEAFREKYDKEPDTYAALAYDTANLILDAMRENGATREGILAYLNNGEDFNGVAGPVTFIDNGSTRNIIVLTVKDGQFMPADEQP